MLINDAVVLNDEAHVRPSLRPIGATALVRVARSCASAGELLMLCDFTHAFGGALRLSPIGVEELRSALVYRSAIRGLCMATACVAFRVRGRKKS